MLLLIFTILIQHCIISDVLCYGKGEKKRVYGISLLSSAFFETTRTKLSLIRVKCNLKINWLILTKDSKFRTQQNVYIFFHFFH